MPPRTLRCGLRVSDEAESEEATLSPKLLIATSVVQFALMGLMPALAEDAPRMAVAQFTFSDTSGEASDQHQRHKDQLADFEAAVLVELKQHRQVTPVELSCPAASC